MLPKLAALMDDAECDVLAYELSQGSPAENPVHQRIERPNSEIKRRTEVVSIFPDEKAIKRLVGAILLEQNDEWAVQRSLYDAGKDRRFER